MAKAEKEVIQAKSLADLSTRKITIIIEREDQTIEIPAHTLTWAAWRQVEREIPKPTPPSRGSPKGVIYQRDDPTYLDALEECSYKISLARLVRCLDLPIAGDTLDEQITTLQETLDRAIVQALIIVLGKEHNLGEARIIQRADGF